MTASDYPEQRWQFMIIIVKWSLLITRLNPGRARLVQGPLLAPSGSPAQTSCYRFHFFLGFVITRLCNRAIKKLILAALFLSLALKP